MKNLTIKEIELLKVFMPKQDLNDMGFGSMFFKELADSLKCSVNSCKGLVSSLQSKEILMVDDSNGKPLVCLGNFLYDQKAEEIFEELKNL